MKKELILILVAILISASAYSKAEEPDSPQKNVKTGDIEVTASLSDKPPGAKELMLTLCSMPKMKPVKIPDWVGKRPNEPRLIKAWSNEIIDSLGDSGQVVLDYIGDSLGVRGIIYHNISLYKQDVIAVGVTDSSGKYTFRNIPAGRYRIICEYNNLNKSQTSFLDTLTQRAKDSIRESINKMRNDSTMALPIDQGNPNPEKGLIAQIIYIPIIVEYVRIAGDSISVVKTGMQQISSREARTNLSIIWQAKFKERGTKNEAEKE